MQAYSKERTKQQRLALAARLPWSAASAITFAASSSADSFAASAASSSSDAAAESEHMLLASPAASNVQAAPAPSMQSNASQVFVGVSSNASSASSFEDDAKDGGRDGNVIGDVDMGNTGKNAVGDGVALPQQAGAESATALLSVSSASSANATAGIATFAAAAAADASAVAATAASASAGAAGIPTIPLACVDPHAFAQLCPGRSLVSNSMLSTFDLRLHFLATTIGMWAFENADVNDAPIGSNRRMSFLAYRFFEASLLIRMLIVCFTSALHLFRSSAWAAPGQVVFHSTKCTGGKIACYDCNRVFSTLRRRTTLLPTASSQYAAAARKCPHRAVAMIEKLQRDLAKRHLPPKDSQHAKALLDLQKGLENYPRFLQDTVAGGFMLHQIQALKSKTTRLKWRDDLLKTFGVLTVLKGGGALALLGGPAGQGQAPDADYDPSQHNLLVPSDSCIRDHLPQASYESGLDKAAIKRCVERALHRLKRQWRKSGRQGVPTYSDLRFFSSWDEVHASKGLVHAAPDVVVGSVNGPVTVAAAAGVEPADLASFAQNLMICTSDGYESSVVGQWPTRTMTGDEIADVIFALQAELESHGGAKLEACSADLSAANQNAWKRLEARGIHCVPDFSHLFKNLVSAITDRDALERKLGVLGGGRISIDIITKYRALFSYVPEGCISVTDTMKVSTFQGLANNQVIEDLLTLSVMPDLQPGDKEQAIALAEYLRMCVMAFRVMEVKRTSAGQDNPDTLPFLTMPARLEMIAELRAYFDSHCWVSQKTELTLLTRSAVQRLIDVFPLVAQSLQDAGAPFSPRALSSDKNENYFSLVRAKHPIFSIATYLQCSSKLKWVHDLQQAGRAVSGVWILTSNKNNNFRGVLDARDDSRGDVVDDELRKLLMPPMHSKKTLKKRLERAALAAAPAPAHADAAALALDAGAQPMQIGVEVPAAAIAAPRDSKKCNADWKAIHDSLSVLQLLPSNNVVSMRSTMSRTGCFANDAARARAVAVIGEDAARRVELVAALASKPHMSCICPVPDCKRTKPYANRFAQALKTHIWAKHAAGRSAANVQEYIDMLMVAFREPLQQKYEMTAIVAGEQPQVEQPQVEAAEEDELVGEDEVRGAAAIAFIDEDYGSGDEDEDEDYEDGGSDDGGSDDDGSGDSDDGDDEEDEDDLSDYRDGRESDQGDALDDDD